MSGALIELVSKGAQDAFITGDPQVSFFRQNYKRHTNFSMKPVELNVVGTQAAGNEVILPIEPKGDLLTHVWCDISSIGTAGTDQVQASESQAPTEFSLHIGGVEIDRQDAFFLNRLWPKFLATSASKHVSPEDDNETFLPLHFFHCDNATTPLPLVAMQYHKAEIRVRHSINSAPAGIKYYANYVMLDTDERKYFTDNQHDFLITQVQRIGATDTGSDLMYLNHPVKALLWGSSGSCDTDNVQLRVNGSDVFGAAMPNKFFYRVSAYYNSEFAPLTPGLTDDTDTYMYSFATSANKHQPTGTCNFSRIDNAKLTWSGDSPTYLYGVNYNILTVKSGMVGLKFSN